MLKAVAIDDEPRALTVVEEFASAYPWLSLERTFTRSEEAMRYLTRFPVDLLFLDIQMPSVNGLKFYQSLPVEQQPMVIFTTAYSEYAVEGFNVDAVDYLLKPFTRDRFEKAVLKAKEKFDLSRNGAADTGAHILLRADYGLHKIVLEEIRLIEGSDDYILIHLTNRNPMMVRMTMKAIMDKLPSPSFVRVHRSFIIPIKRIETVRQKTIYIDGREVPIGASYEEEFFTVFQ